jgi:DNA-directed RNA polymerase subunit beta
MPTVLTPKAQARRAKTQVTLPNLVEMQLQSFENFLNEGLRELFDSFSPIEDFTGTLSLEFLEYNLGEPKWDPNECRERDLTYEMPLKVKVRLVNKETGELKESEVYLGEVPCMTERGTFIINGAERVVVSQLSRSPGVYFSETIDYSGRSLYTGQVIPREGVWVEVETDVTDVISAKIGQSRRTPITTLLRAFSAMEAAQPHSPKTEFLLARSPKLPGRTLAEPVIDPLTGEMVAEAGAVVDEELARRLRAIAAHGGGDNQIAVVAQRLRAGTTGQILELFGQRETLRRPKADALVGKWTAEDIMPPPGDAAPAGRGRVRPLVRAYTHVDEDTAKAIESLRLDELDVITVNRYIERSLENDRARDEETALNEVHKVLRPGDPPTQESARSLLQSFFFDPKRYDLGRVGRYKMNKKIGIDVPLSVTTQTLQDLIAIVDYIIGLSGEPGASERGEGLVYETDDIDHLRNKRVRSVGELLQNQLRAGFLRMERVARERLTSLDREAVTPQAVISIKPITAAVRSFFGSGQLSQFMQQTNPLDELTHKRRLSVLGPGGLSRQSAKLEVRDVHHSHYGRICPIETPEGPNIGLISSMATLARVNEFGFIQSPYRRVVNGRVTEEIVYLTADEEDPYHIAPATHPVDENGHLLGPSVLCRQGSRHPEVAPNQVDLIDLAPIQVFSVATGLIPFLENDDANRALMGSNMQRQAVPLIRPQAPLVKTGIEKYAAVDSGAVITAEASGVVAEVDAKRIVVQGHDGERYTYPLRTFVRSNQTTCIHQRPIVRKGQRVRRGEPIADGPATDHGQLALGTNLTVAFMLWEGYNYEDAIILSERVARDDLLTSIHIERHETEARETKLGPEEITRDIPNVGEDQLRNLDEHGVIRVGAEVKQEDILVGKVAPKSQGELTAEERLVIAIFGKKAEEMRDASLRLPHGESGTVVDVRIFSRHKYHCPRCQLTFDFVHSDQRPECEKCGGSLDRQPGDELKPSTNQMVRVYCAQKRKIMEGDKMAGRHGNKGVISKILPDHDMPYLPDGTPVDIILNPLGVPSRMNIGQILEMHLGLTAKFDGVSFENPIFEGANAADVTEGLRKVADKMRIHTLENYVASELSLNLNVGDVTALTWKDVLARVRAALEELDEDALKRVGVLVAVPPEQWAWGLPYYANEEEFNADLQAAPKPPIDAILTRVEQVVNQRTGFNPDTGKCILYDGRTGEPFNQPIAIGQVYMMKLAHLVEDKIHARSTGPYSLVTQQPLGGKAQFGGQRFGEMEVWALEAYGAAHILQEILTIKSDDVTGRVKTYESIVKGETLMEPGIPESFKILVKELQSLGLQITVESKDGQVMELRDTDDDEKAGDKGGNRQER